MDFPLTFVPGVPVIPGIFSAIRSPSFNCGISPRFLKSMAPDSVRDPIFRWLVSKLYLISGSLPAAGAFAFAMSQGSGGKGFWARYSLIWSSSTIPYLMPWLSIHSLKFSNVTPAGLFTLGVVIYVTGFYRVAGNWFSGESTGMLSNVVMILLVIGAMVVAVFSGKKKTE